MNDLLPFALSSKTHFASALKVVADASGAVVRGEALDVVPSVGHAGALHAHAAQSRLSVSESAMTCRSVYTAGQVVLDPGLVDADARRRPRLRRWLGRAHLASAASTAGLVRRHGTGDRLRPSGGAEWRGQPPSFRSAVPARRRGQLRAIGRAVGAAGNADAAVLLSGRHRLVVAKQARTSEVDPAGDRSRTRRIARARCARGWRGHGIRLTGLLHGRKGCGARACSGVASGENERHESRPPTRHVVDARVRAALRDLRSRSCSRRCRQSRWCSLPARRSEPGRSPAHRSCRRC